MSWFFLAIVGHLANGIAFVIDKILLRSAFSRSATYAGVVGILSFVVIFLLPFVDVWPTGIMWLIALASGATFILALWAFFAALARAEASRVVPIVGSLIPILTLAGSFVFLGEHLSDRSFVGFFLLIIATIILSGGGGKGKLTHATIWMAITSAVLFAVASVTAKATYDTTGFLGGFIITRIAAAATALLLLFVIDRAAGKEAILMFHPKYRASRGHKQPGTISAILAVIGQGLGAVGFLFVQWATSQGSVSVVNAMQAVQYAFLVLVALALRHRAPQLLGENLTRRTLIIKCTALVITAIGMYLIV
jgi:drug/metabolite transporter (DMT)-like permease